MKLRWSHIHTAGAAGAAGMIVARGPALALIGTLVFLAGVLLGRFWANLRNARKRLQAEVAHRVELQRIARLEKMAGLREKRAKARLAESKATDAKAVALEAKRRAKRAAGLTESEVATLQAGMMNHG